MTTSIPSGAEPEESRIAAASLDIAAPAATIFELIANPAVHPQWDGNDNLAHSGAQRVHHVAEIFDTTLTNGQVRSNHVVEFDEGRRIAWRPSLVGGQPIGHLWRWELEVLSDTRTRVTHTYDWTDLDDETRIPTARATTPDRLLASINRLAVVATER